MPNKKLDNGGNEKEIKVLLWNQMIQNLNNNISETNKSLEAMKEARNGETKSSAGDKYETGRAMMQIEIDKYQLQLSKTRNLKNELQNIQLDKKYQQVEIGSLVFTNVHTYFISIGMGKLCLNDTPYFAISLASPIGALLKHKKVGDSILFNNQKTEIKSIA